MSDAKKPANDKSFEERKKALIAQGAAQRQKIDASIVIIRENLHADKLAKSAMSHITAKAYGAVDKLFGRHHVEKVDLTDLGENSGASNGSAGISSSLAKFTNLTNGDHAAGKLIATVRRFLPLATTAFGILRRRKLVMPVVKGAAVLGGVGAGAYFYYRHKQRMDEEANERDDMPYAYHAEPARTGVLDGHGQLH